MWFLPSERILLIYELAVEILEVLRPSLAGVFPCRPSLPGGLLTVFFGGWTLDRLRFSKYDFEVRMAVGRGIVLEGLL